MQDVIAADWFKFVTRYCGGYKGKFGWVTDGATNMLELNKKLRESNFLFFQNRAKREGGEVKSEVIEFDLKNQKIKTVFFF